jgi:hypothetical protein
MVLQSSRTLADLAEQTVIPADYLYTLIIFFMFMVRRNGGLVVCSAPPPHAALRVP